MTSMKTDVELFSRLYISCQMRDGNLEDFFQYENQAWPPALSQDIYFEYAQQVFIPYISSQLRSVSRVNLVWDTYKDEPSAQRG